MNTQATFVKEDGVFRRLHTPEVVAMLKAKSPAEKLGMAFEMQKLARGVLFSRIRSQHPDWTSPEIDKAVALRMSRGER